MAKTFFENLKIYDGDDIDVVIPLRHITHIEYKEYYLEIKTSSDNTSEIDVYKYDCPREIANQGIQLYLDWCSQMDFADNGFNDFRKSIDNFLEESKKEFDKLKEKTSEDTLTIKNDLQTDLNHILESFKNEANKSLNEFKENASQVLSDTKTATEQCINENSELIKNANIRVNSLLDETGQNINKFNAIIERYMDILSD